MEYLNLCCIEKLNNSNNEIISMSEIYQRKQIDSSELSKICIKQEEIFHNFCPRCEREMQEPRLLPCLHPMCSICVFEVMNQVTDNSANRFHIGKCPLCNYELPKHGSLIPPPHYLLQHRLVLNAVRGAGNFQVLCDICTNEVVAQIQCIVCLLNFCINCGTNHRENYSIRHYLRPLCKMTNFRRTAICEKHPTRSLKYYCIACQQVTCIECMWGLRHRGHASESAIDAGDRITVRLTGILRRAKDLLDLLLKRYNRDVFDTR